MMDNLSTVVEALRQTSKGRLQYDRHRDIGPEFQNSLNDLCRRMNSLAFLPPTAKANTTTLENVFTKQKPQFVTSKTKKVKSSDLFVGEDTSAKMLAEYERARTESVKAAVAKRAAELQQQTEFEAVEAEKKLQRTREQRFFELQKQHQEQLVRVAARNEELEQWRTNQKERLDYITQLMDAKIREAEMTQKQLDDETRQNHLKQLQQQMWAESIHSCQKAITQNYLIINEALKNCYNVDLLPSSVKDDLHKQKEVADSLDRLINTAKLCSLTQSDIDFAQQLVELISGHASKLLQAIEFINQDQQQQIQDQLNVANDQAEVLNVSEQFSHVPTPQHEEEMATVYHDLNKPRTQKPSSTFNELSTFCASPEALHEYEYLKNFMESYQQQYLQLKTNSNSSTKKYKFDLQKAVNIPVNAISSLSGSHVRDKLERLQKLLNGQTVEVSGKLVSSKEHPQAIPFCKDLLAKKFVKQAEEQVASKFEAAFPIAATIIGLWIQFPDFGSLLLGHFHKKCPYLVPYYPPKLEGSTQEEYYMTMGYIYIDGVIEKQDKFLKRMSGLMRLYAAIICSPVPPGFKQPHPHGVENGWKWMARVLNLEPWSDVTATLLFDFLETCSHAMNNAYGSQFQKLLLILCKEFFNKIKKVTAAGSGGPVLRLENILQKMMQRRNIPPPEGMLSSQFWYY